MAVKPGDRAAFVAVDDFTFSIDDICETMPIPGGDTTPAPETTATPPSL